MRTGFVPSYVLESGLGKRVAKLKRLNRGWSYPTFLIQYIRNPGPFLLYDRIIIDAEAADRAIENARRPNNEPFGYENRVVSDTNPTEREIDVLDELLKSNLFVRKNIADVLTEGDYEKIKTGYYRDTGIHCEPNGVEHVKRFNQALSIMKEKYGPMYARPDPESFEAMNLNLIQVISKRLVAEPLDDICRVPLYQAKFTDSQLCMSNTSYEVAFKVIDRARQILYLPSNPINDSDDFLKVHKDKNVQRFRKKIQELTVERADTKKISREIAQAEVRLRELDSRLWNLALGFLGLAGSTYGIMSGNFVSGTTGTISAVMGIGRAVRSYWNAKGYEWLKVVKGFSEVRG